MVSYGFIPDDSSEDKDPLPFYEFAVTRWEFDNGWFELESYEDGTFFLDGKIDGRYIGDDGEGYAFDSTNELLNHLEECGLLAALSAKADTDEKACEK